MPVTVPQVINPPLDKNKWHSVDIVEACGERWNPVSSPQLHTSRGTSHASFPFLSHIAVPPL